MTNEEIQRIMEFVIKQQESFAESMEQMRESHVKAEARLSQIEGAFVNLYNVVTDLGKAQKELTEKVKELAEAQAHTDQRVNVLIDIIEKGRNGNPQN